MVSTTRFRANTLSYPLYFLTSRMQRWGDAPVHSIAAALFKPKDQIHFFHDIGYEHPPYNHCPLDKTTWQKGRCSCGQGQSFGNALFFHFVLFFRQADWKRFSFGAQITTVTRVWASGIVWWRSIGENHFALCRTRGRRLIGRGQARVFWDLIMVPCTNSLLGQRTSARLCRWRP